MSRFVSAPRMAVKKSSQLTLHDRLSRLTIQQAAKWLGPDGARLLKESGKAEIDPAEVSWPDDQTFQAIVMRGGNAPVVVTLKLGAGGRDGVRWACSERKDPAARVADVLSFILEEKTALGLAAPPPEEQALPLELLDEAELERRALAEREKRAREEKMDIARVVRDADRANGKGPWCDYLVKSALSGKTWRVALRGWGAASRFARVRISARTRSGRASTSSR